MQNNPDKFTQLFDSAPYRTESPWYRAMQSGNFELIDHVALRQQLKLLKINYAKQLILEGLMEKPEVSETTSFFGDSLVQHINAHKQIAVPAGASSAPTKLRMAKAQYDIAMKFAEQEIKVKAAKARK
jgi:hypothetical protein